VARLPNERLHDRYKRASVHVSVTRTKGSPDQPTEIAAIAGEEMLRWLQQIQGFEGLLVLSNGPDGTTLVLTFWESREVADRHRAARMRLRDRVTATVDVQVEETVDYEVMLAHLGSDDRALRLRASPDRR
jgi:heme-degrading monooxygenase HmoA